MFSRTLWYRGSWVGSVCVAGAFATTTSDGKETAPKTSYHDCVIIGAGWAGLGVAACLSDKNVSNYIVLEKGNCVGYFWSRLYDTIRMNTFHHKLWHSPDSIEPPENKDYRTKVL